MAKAAASGKSPRAEKSLTESGGDALTEAAPTFEEAMAELQQIVNDLEDNSLGLEASLVQFERGIGLLRNCHSFLEQAEQKIEILVSFKANGEATTAPFDATPTAGAPDPKTLF
jgi:exodeoxyribonuclease VII small subunit